MISDHWVTKEQSYFRTLKVRIFQIAAFSLFALRLHCGGGQWRLTKFSALILLTAVEIGQFPVQVGWTVLMLIVDCGYYLLKAQVVFDFLLVFAIELGRPKHE
jgi:hypothetical protein